MRHGYGVVGRINCLWCSFLFSLYMWWLWCCEQDECIFVLSLYNVWLRCCGLSESFIVCFVFLLYLHSWWLWCWGDNKFLIFCLVFVKIYLIFLLCFHVMFVHLFAELRVKHEGKIIVLSSFRQSVYWRYNKLLYAFRRLFMQLKVEQ